MPDSQKKVLCIDPDKKFLGWLELILSANGYKPLLASTIGHALELLVWESPQLALTEVDFPSVEPEELMRSFRRMAYDTVLIALSARDRKTDDPMRLGTIFQYLHKPVRVEELISQVRLAMAFYREKKLLLNHIIESENRIYNQLDWLLWKEHNRHTDMINYGKLIITNIKTSILQGMGIGSLVSGLGLIELQMQRQGDHYLVPAELLDNQINTSQIVYEWLENMGNITKALDQSYDKELITSEEVDSLIDEGLKAVDKFRKIKNHQVIISKPNKPFDIMSNRLLIRMIIREFLTNAFKFSPPDTRVHIMRYKSGKSCVMAVLNDIQLMEGGVTGLPVQYENQVFEPFYKLNNIYDERFHSEEFSMGTGLTIVQNGLRQIGGKIHLYEITDYATDEEGKKRIIAEAIMPVDDGTVPAPAPETK